MAARFADLIGSGVGLSGILLFTVCRMLWSVRRSLLVVRNEMCMHGWGGDWW